MGAYLTEQKRLSVHKTLDIASQLLKALDYAHQRNMVHRDIKPENVMFSDDNAQHIILTDFSLVRLIDQSDTQTGTKIGTPTYMSPEGAIGQSVDARSDIYSFGVLMYHMLAGQVPFTGRTAVEVLNQQIKQEASPLREHLPDLSKPVADLVHKALAKSAAKRYQTAAEFSAAIDALATPTIARSVKSASNVTPKKPSQPITSNRWVMLAGAVVVILFVAILTALLLLGV